jgi:hypothetical protein
VWEAFGEGKEFVIQAAPGRNLEQHEQTSAIAMTERHTFVIGESALSQLRKGAEGVPSCKRLLAAYGKVDKMNRIKHDTKIHVKDMQMDDGGHIQVIFTSAVGGRVTLTVTELIGIIIRELLKQHHLLDNTDVRYYAAAPARFQMVGGPVTATYGHM